MMVVGVLVMNIGALDYRTLLEIGSTYCRIPTEELKVKVERAIDFKVPAVGEVYLSEITLKEEICVVPVTITTRRLIVNKTVNPELCCFVTLQDVYGTSRISIPARYEFVTFGLPKKGDKFITADGIQRILQEPFGGCSPRIIVKESNQ